MSWSDKAQLISIHIPIIGPNNRGEEKDVVFLFKFPKNTDVYMSVKCLNSHCTKTTTTDPNLYLPVKCIGFNCSSTTTEYYCSNSIPIEFDSVEIDSVEIAQIGLENGGDRKLYHPGGTGQMTLGWCNENEFEENTLDWVVSFATCSDHRCYNYLHIYINPNTGEVIDKE
jgi:hypothetical protein